MRSSFIPTGTRLLFTYFIVVLIGGSVLLMIEGVWGGSEPLGYLDALFTSVSATCVTGLITVDTALYSRTGQVIIACLIQAGGLGIIVFTTLSIAAARGRISFSDRKLVKDYYVESVEYRPGRIVRNVAIMTLVVEIAGAIALYRAFRLQGVESPAFVGAFHAVSAFCNAGFSTFTANLEEFRSDLGITVPVMVMVVLGGIGFVVVQDVVKWISRGRHVVSVHTKAVTSGTAALIAVGVAGILLFESGSEALGNGPSRFWSALFQSVTPRTAGFNTVPQSALTLPSKMLTMILMFVGGGPGSIAGGVKITPVFLLLSVIIVGADRHGEVRVFRRRIPERLVARSLLFLLKAGMLLAASVLLLSITESLMAGTPKDFVDIVFEAVSAFGTVGLSTGITSSLTNPGKVVVILTMFAGRVGLISLALPKPTSYLHRGIDYPTGEILLG